MDDDNETKVNETDFQQIAKVGLKMPPIWKNNIKLWFIQVESNFILSGISQDATKYNALVASLDTECLTAVSDILLKPPSDKQYDTLKERLISEFSDSETRRVQKLLSTLQLGDLKPSFLLRQMRELANNSLSDDFLKNLWMQRLPREIQTILSASSETLNNLANLADKIAEVRTDTLGVNAVNQTHINPQPISQFNETKECAKINSHSEKNEISALREEIKNLTEQVQRLSRQTNRGYNNFKRRNSKSPFRKNNYEQRNNENETNDYCFYHKKFGNKAYNCVQPCNYRQTQNDSEN